MVALCLCYVECRFNACLRRRRPQTPGLHVAVRTLKAQLMQQLYATYVQLCNDDDRAGVVISEPALWVRGGQPVMVKVFEYLRVESLRDGSQ